MVWRPSLLCGVAALLAACDDPAKAPRPDGGPPVALEILDPPGSQIGLHFGKSIDLRVLVRTDDATQSPLAGQTVRFSIFGDPEGSTLSADRAVTLDDGVATVSLSGGAAETTFRVTASTPGAADAQFAISVSEADFVGIEVQLQFTGAATLQTLLYDNLRCAQLGPTATPPMPLRQLAQSGASASLLFLNLLSRDYAVAGRAEDANGRLLAAACVDLDAGLLAAGSTATLPLPLVAVRVSAVGTYQLTTALTVSAPAVTGPFHALADCVNYPADAIDDAIEVALQPTGHAATFAAQRGVKDAAGCRGALAGGGASIDQQLHSLLTSTGAPATQLRAIVADLDAIVGAAQLTSRLAIAASGPNTLTADHRLEQLRLDATGQQTVTYDLAAAGVPIIEAQDVPVAFDGASVSLGAHGFAVRLPQLWRSALDQLALLPRFPMLMSPSLRALLGLVVGAAMHGGKTGCAAVADLACAADSVCAAAVEKACPAGLDALGAQLEASFDPQTGLDLTLRGQAQAVDSDGDLYVDRLQMGAWTTPLATTSTFTGTRTP